MSWYDVTLIAAMVLFPIVLFFFLAEVMGYNEALRNFHKAVEKYGTPEEKARYL